MKSFRVARLLVLIGIGSLGFLAASAAAREPSAAGDSGATASEQGPAAESESDLPPNTDSSDETDESSDLGAMDEGFEYEQDYGEGEDLGAPEEIVIRAAKANKVEDLAISSQSFSSTDLREMRIGDIEDMAKFTPGLEINTAFAASNPTLFIRGVGLKDYNANSAGAVAVYQDGISINSPAGQLFQLFDVQNVSVLKGPQGGRFGRNATAGAIIIDANKPTGEWGTTGSLTVGNYNAVEMEGALSFPLVSEILSGRVAFAYNRRDGHTRNGCANWNPLAHGQKLVSRQSITDTYWALDPSPAPIDVVKTAGGPVSSKYVFRDAAKIAELVADGNTAQLGGAWFDANTGAPVRLQKNTFGFSGKQDVKCVVELPGSVTTARGADPNNVRPGFALPAGSFNPTANVATFEDFQGLKKYTNNVHDWAARMMFLYTPTENMEWLFNVHGGQNLSDSRHLQQISATTIQNACSVPEGRVCKSPEQFVNPFRQVNTAESVNGWTEFRAGERAVRIPTLRAPPPNPLSQKEGGQGGADPFLGWYDADGLELLNVWGVSITGTWELENFTVHSITGYEANDRLVEDEGDASPRNLFKTNWSDEAWQVSQEFRVEAETDRLRWHLGGYFLYENLKALNEFPAVLGFTWNQFFDQQVISGAPFGYVAFDFFNEDNSLAGLEKLTVEASFRYNVENKKFGLGSEIFKDAGATFEQLAPSSAEKTWKDLIGDITISYTPIAIDLADVTARVKYSRGVKSGHFNGGLTINDDATGQRVNKSKLTPVKPERVHAIEIGFDTTWFDNVVTLDVAYFRYWYENLQVFDLVNEAATLPTQQLLNSDSNIYGVEASLLLTPVPGVELGARVNWVRSTFEDFFVTKRELAGGGQGGGKRGLRTFDYSGNSTVAAPEWTLHAHAQAEIPLRGWGYLTPRFDTTYQSRVFLDPQGLDLIGWPAYWLFDLRLAYLTPDERIELAAWVNNVADEQYAVDVFDVSREFRTILQVYGDPRTFGLTLSLLF